MADFIELDKIDKNGDIPTVAEQKKTLELIGIKAESSQVLPCESCSNDLEKGGNCARIFFSVAEGKVGYVCERKKPLEITQ
jgi:hypothetical protein